MQRETRRLERVLQFKEADFLSALYDKQKPSATDDALKFGPRRMHYINEIMYLCLEFPTDIVKGPQMTHLLPEKEICFLLGKCQSADAPGSTGKGEANGPEHGIRYLLSYSSNSCFIFKCSDSRNVNPERFIVPLYSTILLATSKVSLLPDVHSVFDLHREKSLRSRYDIYPSFASILNSCSTLGLCADSEARLNKPGLLVATSSPELTIRLNKGNLAIDQSELRQLLEKFGRQLDMSILAADQGDMNLVQEVVWALATTFNVTLNQPELKKSGRLLDASSLTADQVDLNLLRYVVMAVLEEFNMNVGESAVKNLRREDLLVILKRLDRLRFKVNYGRGEEEEESKYFNSKQLFELARKTSQFDVTAQVAQDDYENKLHASIQYDEVYATFCFLELDNIKDDMFHVVSDQSIKPIHVYILGPHKLTKDCSELLPDLEELLQGKADISYCYDLHSQRAQQDSNEKPMQGYDELKTSLKNDLNARADAEEVTTEVGHPRVDHFDLKDLHPLGERLGPQTLPKRIEETKPFDDIVDKTRLTILSPEGYEIPVHFPSKPHPSSPPPRPSEECIEPLPADTQIHSSDLSARLGKKSCEAYYPDITDRDELFSTRDVPMLKKGFEQTCDDDIIQEADEGYYHRTEPKGIPPAESPAPAAPETTADRTEEQAVDKHQEIEDSAEDSSSLSAPKVKIPQTETSQDRLLGSERSLADVSLRHNLEKTYGELENQMRQYRASPDQNTSTEVGSSMTTQKEESSALKGPASSGEFQSVSRLKVLPKLGSEDRGQTSENRTPQSPRQSVTEEPTTDYGILPSEEENLPANPSQVDLNFHKSEIPLEELCIGNDGPEIDSVHRPEIAGEDHVSPAVSKGNFPPQDSRLGTDESRLDTLAEPFHSVNARKKQQRESLEQLLRENGILFNFHSLLSLWEFLRDPSLTITIRPFFPDLQNGAIDVDFRTPVRATMTVEGFRLCTFLYCPNAEALPALRLANAGFYYTGRDGVVACYCCDLRCRHDHARLQGDPYAFHRERNPHCPHLNNINQSHLFIQPHQTSAHSGRDITDSPSERTRREERVPEMTAKGNLALGQSITRMGAVNRVNTETNAARRAALHGAGSEQKPHSSAADVSPHGTTSTSAGTEGESPRSPHSVSSSNSNNEGAENSAGASTNTITNTASNNTANNNTASNNTSNNNTAYNNTARQDSPASSQPPGVEAVTHTTSRQTASSTASQQVNNTSLPNSGRGQLANGERDTSSGNRSAANDTTERRSADISFSSGYYRSENPRTERPPQEELESRQTSSRPNNATVSTVHTNEVHTNEQRSYAPTRGNNEPIAGNDSRSSRPRMGLLGGSSEMNRHYPHLNNPNQDHLFIQDHQTSAHVVFSAVNGSASVANHTTQRGEAPPSTPRQAETVTPPSATRPAPSAPPFDASRAVHSQYAATETRVRSFEGRWPDTHAQSPEELAEAGFFYAGAEDCVRCHYCGLGLKHWDPEDRPLEEHMRWRSSCGYLRSLMGEDEIARTLARIGRRPNEASGQPAAGLPSARRSVANGNPHQMASPDLRAETEQFMTSEIVMAARDMGFSEDSIRRGIGALLQTSAGRRAVTSQNLVHAILFLRERGRDLDSPTLNNTNVVDVSSDDSDDERAPLPSNDSQANQRAIARDNATGSGSAGNAALQPSRDEMVSFVQTDQDGSHGNVGQQPGSLRSAPDSSSSSQPRQSQPRADASTNGETGPQTIRQLEQENQELRERRRCKICLDNDVNILFLPCGHLVCCAECAPALRRCPICRRRVSGTISIQFAGVPSGRQQ